MKTEKFLDIILPFLKKLPVPYFAAFIFVAVCFWLATFPQVKVFLFAPEWKYSYDEEAETANFQTVTNLKSGKITVRTQLELEYGDKVFYIIEIQGLYNINEIILTDANAKGNDMDASDETRGTKFCMTVEKQQRDILDDFETKFQTFLEEHLKEEYRGKFCAERF